METERRINSGMIRHLKVGERVGYLDDSGSTAAAIYAGISANYECFSIAVIRGMEEDRPYAYNLYFPVTQKNLTLGKSSFVIHRLTPEELRLEERV